MHLLWHLSLAGNREKGVRSEGEGDAERDGTAKGMWLRASLQAGDPFSTQKDDLM